MGIKSGLTKSHSKYFYTSGPSVTSQLATWSPSGFVATFTGTACWGLDVDLQYHVSETLHHGNPTLLEGPVQLKFHVCQIEIPSTNMLSLRLAHC